MTKLSKKQMQSKRKPIKLRRGGVVMLARDCSVTEKTVRRALNWYTDSDTQNLIRKRASDLGLIRRF